MRAGRRAPARTATTSNDSGLEPGRHLGRRVVTGRPMRDPVCGMEVKPETAAGSYKHAGRTYYFCGRHCLEKFRAEPMKYLPSISIGRLRPPATSAPPAPRPSPPVAPQTYT